MIDYLLGHTMFQFPHAQRRQEQRLSTGKRAGAGKSGTFAAVLRLPVRGRPRGLALALLTLRAAPSLSGRFARFILDSWEQLPSQYARKRLSVKTACSLFTSPSLSFAMANRKLGCLTLFLFLALCASALVNIFLTFGLIGRFSSGFVREEVPPRFRELMVQPERAAAAIASPSFFCAD